MKMYQMLVALLLFVFVGAAQGADYFDPGAVLVPGTTARAEDLNDKFTAVDTAFGKVEADTTRAVKLPVGTLTDQVITQSAGNRAGKVIAFDGSGNIQLAPGVGTWRGDWQTGIQYYARDIVRYPDVTGQTVQYALLDHVSTTFAADIAKWQKVLEPPGICSTDATTLQGNAASAFVPVGRTVSTTAPLTGGGALTGNLSLVVSPATEIASGVVELATAAETTTGTDATRAVHPSGLKVELDKKVNNATVAAAATANTIPLRDASGRAKVAAGAASDDAVNKGQLDTKANLVLDWQVFTGRQIISKSGQWNYQTAGIQIHSLDSPAILSLVNQGSAAVLVQQVGGNGIEVRDPSFALARIKAAPGVASDDVATVGQLPTIPTILTGSQAIPEVTVAIGESAIYAITVTGAAIGDPVIVGAYSDFGITKGWISLTGFVRQANVVTVYLKNEGYFSVVIPAQTIKVKVFK